MKIIGIAILVAGLLLGVFALTMDVSVSVESRDFGYGITTPSMRVANVDLMAQRQNYLIFSGILAVVGAILTGFASMSPQATPVTAEDSVAAADQSLEEEDTSSDHLITKRDGIYVVGEYHFDTLTDARNFASSIS